MLQICFNTSYRALPSIFPRNSNNFRWLLWIQDAVDGNSRSSSPLVIWKIKSHSDTSISIRQFELHGGLWSQARKTNRACCKREGSRSERVSWFFFSALHESCCQQSWSNDVRSDRFRYLCQQMTWSNVRLGDTKRTTTTTTTLNNIRWKYRSCVAQ